MNPAQRCLQAKVKNRNEAKHVKSKSQDLNRLLEIKVTGTFYMEFPTLYNKTCTYIT